MNESIPKKDKKLKSAKLTLTTENTGSDWELTELVNWLETDAHTHAKIKAPKIKKPL